MGYKANILIVEDEIIIARDLESRLYKLGYDVCGNAASAEKALELAGTHKPDLVLMDIFLEGDLDGIEAAEIIKRKWGIPVVFLTAYADMERIERAKGIHPFGYILKPFQDRELKVTVELALYASRIDAERRKVEGALRESELKANKYLEIAGVAILALDSEGLITMINKRGLEILGYKQEELLGKNWFTTCLPERSREEVRGVFEKLMRGELEPVRYFENPVLRKDGSERIIAWHNAYFQDSFGAITEILSSGEDVTERKQVEEALRVSEERFKLAIEGTHDGLWDWNLVTDEAFRSDQFALMLGYKPDELPYTSAAWSDLLHPDDVESAFKNVENYLQRKTDKYESTFRMKTKDGSYRWITGRGKCLYDDQGNPVRFVGFNTDITERMQAEEALRESEERYRLLFEKSETLISIYNAKGVCLMMNEKTAELFGGLPADFIGKSFSELHPDASLEYTARIAKAINTGETGTYDDYVEFPQGNRWLLSSVHPVMDSHSKIYAAQIMSQNITDRKRAEEELRNSQAELEQILEALPEGLAYTDRERRIICINSAFTRIFGYNIEEVIGKKTEILYARSEDFVEQGRQRYNVNARDMHTPYEIEYRRKNGEFFPGETVGTPVRDAQDRVIGFIGLIRDITEIKRTTEERERLQEQLQQAQKMEAVGTLAGGIAHDFNNLLQAISGYAQLIIMDTDKKNPIYDNLTGISAASQRAKELIQQLLLFSRKVEAERRPVELNRVIEHAYKILERTIPKMIEIELNLAGRLWNVKADPVQMEQILLNLGKNAADSMPDGGKLIIDTENTIIKEDYVQIHLGMKPGRFVLLTVSDTGHGMDKDTLQHIFEPFYTTKEIGRGTGLGLASIYGIVKSHGGNITCYSEVNQGTVFKIYLPAIEEEEIEIRKEIDPELPQRGTETVLLVDDEESIRDFVTQALDKFGYTIHTAASGEEALEIYADRSKEIDLIILDIGMPGMGGHKCFQEIIRIYPKAKVLIASGYSIDGRLKKTLESGASGYVGKPYQVRDLLNKVRAVLDEV